MIQQMIRYVRGYVKVRVLGDSAERFLNLCSHHEIFIWGLEPKQNAYELYMTIRGFQKIRPLARKTHTKVRLVKRYGLPFFLYQNRCRQAFAVGLGLFMILLLVYSSFIWDIHFEGNERWTDETLLEFLETKQVTAAMPKRKVDCAQIVKEVRAQYDDIVWVSASIEGSRLRIQIKENEDTFRKDEEDVGEDVNTTAEAEAPTDLVATEDGVITSMITRRGVPKVHVGDAVKKGDILVSGRVEVLNDAKEVVDYQYQQSDADIYADTTMEYQDMLPLQYEEKQYESKKTRTAWYVKSGTRTISIGFTKPIKEKRYERYTKEWRIKLGESFYLPLSYGKIVMRPYTTKMKKYPKTEIQRQLTEKFNSFLKDLTEKGIQICENDVKIHVDKNSATAKGTLYVNKQITKAVDTEILEIERTNIDESIGTGN